MSPPDSSKSRTTIFISYAKEDKIVAEKLYDDLKRAGLNPWLDSRDLLPGERFESRISKVISQSRYFLALLSSRSVRKTGYVNKEIRHGLDIALRYPEDEIFVIPVRIDECEPSFEGLRKLHWVDLFPSYGEWLQKMLRLFKYESEEKQALVKVNVRRQRGVIKAKFEKLFGFLVVGGFDHDFFFHANELRGVSFSEIHKGDMVDFAIALGPHGLVAVEVARA
jgi:cold shock CspA family protein